MKLDLSDRRINLTRLVIVYVCSSLPLVFLGVWYGTNGHAYLAGRLTQLVLLVSFTYLILLPKEKFRNLATKLSRPVLYWAVAAILLGVSIRFGIMGMSELQDSITQELSVEKGRAKVSRFVASYDVLLLVLTSGILGPAVEELFYRGLLLSYLCTKMRHGIALWFSALLFAALHGFEVSALVGGLVLGYVYIKSNSLWMPFILHATSNITVVAAGYYEHYRADYMPSLIGLNAFDYVFVVLTVSFTVYVALNAWNDKPDPLQLKADTSRYR